MKQSILVMVIILLGSGQCQAVGIQDLLSAAERQPGYEVRELSVRESGLRKEWATAGLLPKFGLYGQFERYSSPTNLRPMSPTEVDIQAGDSIPFSKDILRYGLNFEAPVYVHELYVLRQKAGLLYQKAEKDRALDLVGRQAAVVSLNGSLTYLQGLERAVVARRKSLGKTLEYMALKVKTGRSSESELLKIRKTMNDLERQLNELAVNRLDTQREIHSLTGVNLTESVPMSLVERPQGETYLAVEAAALSVDAAQKEVQRRRAARYPTLSVTGFVSGNEGEAYNTGDHISRNYNEIALVLKFPLFDPTLSVDEAIARVQQDKAEKELEQTRLDMIDLAETLQRKIVVVESSIELTDQSISDSRTLLKVAQVAVQSGRMTMDDYLNYESDVLNAEAAKFQSRQQLWQMISQQAVIFGIDLKGIVK